MKINKSIFVFLFLIAKFFDIAKALPIKHFSNDIEEKQYLFHSILFITVLGSILLIYFNFNEFYIKISFLYLFVLILTSMITTSLIHFNLLRFK